MGAISPTDVLPDSAANELLQTVFRPVLNELENRGIRYVGFLYAGLIVDNKSGEAKVLEFNCRLGDPETQVLLPRLESDFLEVLLAAADGKLSGEKLQWKTDSAACVVAGSRGYPAEVDDGKTISGLFEEQDGVVVFQAGTVLEDGVIRSKGGRVLTVSALGETREAALKKAYEALKKINFDGMHYRRDIGGGIKQ